MTEETDLGKGVRLTSWRRKAVREIQFAIGFIEIGSQFGNITAESESLRGADWNQFQARGMTPTR